MDKKRLLIGFSGNLEVSYVVPAETTDKKIDLDEGDDYWGIGGTSVDVAIGLQNLAAPVIMRLMVNVGVREDFRRMELSHYLTEAGLDFLFFPVLKATNRAIVRTKNGITEIAGRKHTYADLELPIEKLLEIIESFSPEYCIATGGKPQDAPFTKALFSTRAYNVLNPRPQLLTDDAAYGWPILRRVNLLQINITEMATLLNRTLSTKLTQDDFAPIHQIGPSEVIVTLGGEGSFYSSTDGNFVYQQSYRVDDPRDKTGAGDSFLAGFLTKRLEDASVKAAMDFAARVASAKIKKASGSGMPHRHEIDATP